MMNANRIMTSKLVKYVCNGTNLSTTLKIIITVIVMDDLSRAVVPFSLCNNFHNALTSSERCVYSHAGLTY